MNNTVTGKRINKSKRRDWSQAYTPLFIQILDSRVAGKAVLLDAVLFSFFTAVSLLKVKQFMLKKEGVFCLNLSMNTQQTYFNSYKQKKQVNPELFTS